MSIVSTNATYLFDRFGDFVGYDLPDADPVSITTKFIKTYASRPFDDVDELVYVVRWSNGIWAEMSTIPNRWHHLQACFAKAEAA